jgi:hypothetical protein
MPIFVIVYWPSLNNPNANAISQRLAQVIAANAPWIQISLATWAVQSNSPSSQIYAGLSTIVPSSDLLVVAQISGWEINQGNNVPWHPQALTDASYWNEDSSTAEVTAEVASDFRARDFS